MYVSDSIYMYALCMMYVVFVGEHLIKGKVSGQMQLIIGSDSMCLMGGVISGHVDPVEDDRWGGFIKLGIDWCSVI